MNILGISEDFHQYEQDYLKYVDSIRQHFQSKQDYNKVRDLLKECDKCIKHMETDSQTVSMAQKKILMGKINIFKKQCQEMRERLDQTLVDDGRSAQKEMQENLVENDQIIDEIEKLTNDTEQIAINVHNRMGQGTLSLQNARNKKQELKSNIRKADLTISIMNRKMVVDKSTLYIIIVLLGVIDILAFFNKMK